MTTNYTKHEIDEMANAAALYVVTALTYGSKHELNCIDKIFSEHPALATAKQDFAEFPDPDGFIVLRKRFKDNQEAREAILDEFVTLSVRDLMGRMLAFQKNTLGRTVTANANTVVQVVGNNIRIS